MSIPVKPSITSISSNSNIMKSKMNNNNNNNNKSPTIYMVSSKESRINKQKYKPVMSKYGNDHDYYNDNKKINQNNNYYNNYNNLRYNPGIKLEKSTNLQYQQEELGMWTNTENIVYDSNNNGMEYKNIELIGT